MEDLVVKYAFTYGPLMIFFFAVGFAIWKAAPVTLALMREVVSALNSSTMALNNSTTALNANNAAISNHQKLFLSMQEMWDEMRERIDAFECPHAPPVRKRIVAIKQRQDAA